MVCQWHWSECRGQLAHREAFRLNSWTALAHKDFRQGSWSAHHCTLATIYCVAWIASNAVPWKRPMVHETTPSYITHLQCAYETFWFYLDRCMCVNIMGTSCSFIYYWLLCVWLISEEMSRMLLLLWLMTSQISTNFIDTFFRLNYKQRQVGCSAHSFTE